MVAIGPVVSEEKSFEIVDGRRTDDGRTDDGRRTTEPAYTISSPGAFGSGELKKLDERVLQTRYSCLVLCNDLFKLTDNWPQGYEKFFILSSVELEIFSNIYEQEKYHSRLI